jgi:hypothetical protein
MGKDPTDNMDAAIKYYAKYVFFYHTLICLDKGCIITL